MSQTRIKLKKSSNGRRSSWYWMTWGTIAAYTTLRGMVAPAWAQQPSTPSTVQAPGQTHGLLIREFNIPSGPLDGVLNSFQSATGVSVVVPKDSMRNLWSPGVSGPYTNEAALQKLLHSTGLTYKFTSPVLVRLEIAGQSISIDVTAENSQPSLPKYTQPLLDTPQTIDVGCPGVRQRCDAGIQRVDDWMRFRRISDPERSATFVADDVRETSNLG